ncbi:hypothetical protein N657DRAFT_442809 [Parathielavia appendiculata]|uniref:Uncharacterized protein n=1 Tax=Parathielavia appendiculata TaxID=2587402 RepID=A0AAN6YY67_9PEZI|nr:hypothetical protein N657DRAFT_442809 [Parathielavia appendiculata]
MVKTAITLAALALAASVAALPAATSPTTFSFAQWVEDIIANPDTALTVDEAIAAANEAAIGGSAGGLQRRVWCDQDWPRAPGRDAAACVDYLARIGRDGVTCAIPSNRFDIQMCRIGGAQIAASRSTQLPQPVNCNDVARTAGLIFDSCWRADDTIIGSEICIADRRMQINILGL